MEIPLEGLQHIDCQDRSQRRRKVVAESVITYALSPSGRRKHIYGDRTGGNCRGSERRPVQGPEYCEHRQGTGYDISEKNQEKQEIAQHQDCLSRIIVHHIAAERPYHQSHQSRPRQSHADGIVSGPELFTQIKGKKRYDKGEREIEKKVSRPDLKIIPVPKFLCHTSVVSNKLTVCHTDTSS